MLWHEGTTWPTKPHGTLMLRCLQTQSVLFHSLCKILQGLKIAVELLGVHSPPWRAPLTPCCSLTPTLQMDGSAGHALLTAQWATCQACVHAVTAAGNVGPSKVLGLQA